MGTIQRLIFLCRCQVLFKSPTSNYDFLIHLNPRFLSPTTKTTATETVPAASLPMSEEDLQLTGYQPIRLFIEELQVSNSLMEHVLTPPCSPTT